MSPPLSLLLPVAPLAMALVGAVPARLADRAPARMSRAALGAALVALAASVLGAVGLVADGRLATGTLGVHGIGLALYADALTGSIAVLVAFVGAVVVAYSRSYLDGDPGQGRFLARLCLTLAAVEMLVLSGNLLQFLAAWIATSLVLHRLLLFYPDRPGAQLAARKKFVASRIGELCLVGAALLVWRQYGSLDFTTIFAQAHRHAGAGGDAIALLLAATALLKSAQFPFHVWLPEVMETPTPVSALLHAGIINAGGFLVLRLAPLVAPSTPALDLLAMVGGVTALFGSVVMLTQTSVKVSLAWSTVAQMGFMLLECGLGAFSAALLHLVAHSLYKAHAFLASGSVVDPVRAAGAPAPGTPPRPAVLAAALLLGVVITVAAAACFGESLLQSPGVFALGAVMMMGLAQLLSAALGAHPGWPAAARALGVAVLVAVAYFALQRGAAWLCAGAVPAPQPLRGPFDLAVAALVVLSLGAVMLLQSLLPARAGSRRWQAAYVHLLNGLYLGRLADRILLHLWPLPASGARI